MPLNPADNLSADTQAPTWDDLAVILGRNASSVHRLRHNPAAPTTRNIAEWRAFLAEREASRPAPTTPGVTAAVSDLPGECEYDAPVIAGKTTYARAVQREKSIAERISNEMRRLELAKAKGVLVPKEDAEAAAALVRDRTEQRYDRAIKRALADVASTWPAEMPAEVRDKILKAVDTALDAD